MRERWTIFRFPHNLEEKVEFYARNRGDVGELEMMERNLFYMWPYS